MAAAAPPAERPATKTLGIDRIVLHDLVGDAGDQRGLTFVAALVGAAEPVPALRRISVARLRWIDDQAGPFFRDEVHSGAGGEIVRRLRAAVQHDDERKPLPLMVAAGDEELVGPASSLVAVGAFDELCALRHDVGHRSRRVLDAPQAEPGAVLGAVERRPAPALRSGRRLRRSCPVGLADVVGL